MKRNDNPVKNYRIYLKSIHEWVEVSEDIYRDHTRFYDAYRKRQQSHGKCACPKNRFWSCNGDCLLCEFYRAGDLLSIDCNMVNSDGGTCSLLDTLADPNPPIIDAVCNSAELTALFERLNELMPEAIIIGTLRQKGMTDEAIATIIGISRSTFRSRLKKAREQLVFEFPECF